MATKTDTTATWTDADAQALADLQARQAAVLAEEQRIKQANLRAALQPVLAAFGSRAQVQSAIDALKGARVNLDVDTAMRADRVTLILTNDVLAMFDMASTTTTTAGNASTSATNASA